MRKRSVDIDILDGSWKSIPGFDSKYRVNADGVVISILDRPGSPVNGRIKVINKISDDGPRLYVNIRTEDGLTGKQVAVSKLVLSAFTTDRNLEIIFKDGNPANNKLENLKYCEEPFVDTPKDEKWVPMKDTGEYKLLVSNKGRVFKPAFINYEGKSFPGSYLVLSVGVSYIAYSIPCGKNKTRKVTVPGLMRNHFREDEYDLDEIKNQLT